MRGGLEMIGTCGNCGDTSVSIDDYVYCEHYHNEYVYREAQDEARRDEESLYESDNE